ncbi:MAG: hypothetical protein Q4Q53_08175 [Methanocorpusculum sp.]|nr:hypothetical protein [Methanocorpusculum sp.]
MILDNELERKRLFSAYPQGHINHNLEFIAHTGRNSYFLLTDIETEQELKAKVIEWLSREAIKGGTKATMKYHLDGLNIFLGTSFTPEEVEKIYTYLGNRCNHKLTVRFIESGYDLTVLPQKGENQN